jgi:hypothetical protein
MGLFDRFKNKQDPREKTSSSDQRQESRPQNVTKSADQIIAALESMGYFTFANPAHLQQLKAELGNGLAEEHYFPFIESGRPSYEHLDPRQFILDNETLFERGGILGVSTPKWVNIPAFAYKI